MNDSLAGLGYATKEDRETTLIYKTERPDLASLLDDTAILGAPSNMKGRGRIYLLEPDLVVRNLSHGGMFARITGQRFLSSARSIRELEISAFLLSRGINTPEILAIRIIRGGIFRNISVISKLVPESVDLLTYLRERHPDSEILPVFEQTGDLIRRIHASGVYHADLHIKNILLDKHLIPWILDLDKAYRFSRLGFILKYKTMKRFLHSCRKWQEKNRIMLPDGWEEALRKGYRGKME